MTSGTQINKFADRKPLYFWLICCLSSAVMMIVGMQWGLYRAPPSPITTTSTTTTITTTTTTMLTTWADGIEPILVIWGFGYCMTKKCHDDYNAGLSASYNARMISLDNGDIRRATEFSIETNYDWSACTVIWQNDFYFLGGGIIKKIDENCALSQYGIISESKTYNDDKTFFVYSCFTTATGDIVAPFAGDPKTSYKGESPWTINEMIHQNSTYDHYRVVVPASDDYALAVGSQDVLLGEMVESNNAVEMLDLTTWQWSVRAEYPFQAKIQKAGAIYFAETDEFLVIGGLGPAGESILSHIAAYSPQTDTWTSKGNLLTKRNDIGDIHLITNGFMVYGGDMNEPAEEVEEKYQSEKCIYDNNEFTCNYQFDFGNNVPYGPTQIVDKEHLGNCQ